MFGPFFGEYLVEQGHIERQSLDQAIEQLRHDNRLIGQLALEQGFMTREQVDNALDQQRRLDAPFGELCVELGYMNREQLDELLFMQVRTNGYLGEMLVRQKKLKFEDLGAHLRSFDKVCEAERQEVESALAGTGHHEVGMVMLRCLHLFFMRRGQPTKFSLCKLNAVPTKGVHAHTLPLKVKAGVVGRGEHLIALITTVVFWSAVFPGRDYGQIDEELYLLNHIMSQSLGRAGHPAKPEVVLPYPPKQDKQLVCLQGHNSLDVFWIIYCPPA